MPTLTTLQQRNQAYVRRFEFGELTVRPRLSLVVLTCLDPRVDPAHFWGLTPGDAKVIRNAGARVTDAVIGDLAFVAALIRHVTGDTVPLELAIVQHTECGAGRLADPAFRETIARDSGLDPAALEGRGIADHREAIEADIERLRQSALRLDGFSVSGHLYDVKNGTVSELVPATPLG